MSGSSYVSRVLAMSNPERDVRGFEAKLDDVLGQVGDFVGRLRSASSEDLRFLIAERLHVLGSATIPWLKDMVSDPASSRSLRYLDGVLLNPSEVPLDITQRLVSAGVN